MTTPTQATGTDRAAEARARVEAALAQLRDAMSDLPDRVREEAADVEKAFGKIGDDALREVARQAIRAQHDPKALTTLAGEIRKRKAQLAA